MDLTGNFTKILWPNLHQVNGTALVESTYASINCGIKVGHLFRGVGVGGELACFAGIEYPRPWPLPTYSAQVTTGTSSNPTSTESSRATKKTVDRGVIGTFSK